MAGRSVIRGYALTRPGHGAHQPPPGIPMSTRRRSASPDWVTMNVSIASPTASGSSRGVFSSRR